MSNVVRISRRSARPEHLSRCLRTVQRGTVGLPSECGRLLVTTTAHFNAAASTDDAALPFGLNWIHLVTDHNHLADFVSDLPLEIRRILRTGWPGPLIVEFSEAGRFSELFFNSASFGFFAPRHWFVQSAIAGSAEPLLAAFVDHKTYNASDLQQSLESRLCFDDGETIHEPLVRIRVNGRSWQIVDETPDSRKTVNVMAAKKYLFVCTGNTCRSPMAEGIFREMLAERLQCSIDELEASGFLVASAGLAAGRAHPASRESVDVMRQRGIDLEGHASQPLTQGLLDQADRVFTMTQYHRESILRARPDLADQIEVLSRDGTDVTDPIGGSTDDYIKCCEEIERHLRTIAEDIDFSATG